MNDLTTTQTNGVAKYEPDAFDDYAAAHAGNRLVGSALKFSKGDYLVGRNGDLMAEGTRLAVSMSDVVEGWIKWVDKKPEKKIMGFLKDRFQVPARSTLGDLDESLWPVDKDGKPQDPWQETKYVVMKVPGISDSDALYTFTVSSYGGRRCIEDLVEAYSKGRRMQPRGSMPIVKLGVDVYTHADYGRVKNPKLTIVGWVGPEEFTAALAADAADAAADKHNNDGQDEIPF